jgi:alpha-mannosidase
LLHGQATRLYIANDDHTDYYWTADAETYRNAFINQLDYYIGLMESQNDTLPLAFQHRYNCDNSLWAYEYEKAKPAEDFQRLIDKMKSGHITVPFNPLVPLYGGQNAETALRGMYYGGYLERRYGVDLDMAIMMENQTLPLGISSLWAGAGAKYSWKGVCRCASPDLDYQNRKHEVYYSVGRDGNGVLMKWYDLITNQHLGGYAECRYPNQAIEDLAEKCNTPKYPFSVAGAFGYGWDDLENYLDYFPERARINTNATQQVYVSNEQDFFEDFENEYGNSLPSQSVSFGNDWDLLVATMARVSGDVKRSAEKLRAAEAMASFVALRDPSFGDDLSDQRELAWISLGKYYDHDWTADGPVSSERAQFQRDMEHNFSSYVDSLYARSRNGLSDMIKGSINETRVFVFNPLGGARTDVADLPYEGTLPVAVYDVTTNKEVPTQYYIKSGVQYVRFLAEHVPSVGYKVYRLVNSLPTDLSPAATLSGNEFENDIYALTLSGNGTITSFIDKLHGGIEYNGGPALNDLEAGDPTSGTCMINDTPGPVSVTVTCTSDSPYEHITDITLYKAIPRVDISNYLMENPGNNTLTFSDPINLDNTTVWHEETGAVLKVKTEDHGGHYSMQNARYDWQTANHFVHIGNDLNGMNISNLGSHFFKTGNSSIETLDENSNIIRFLATGKVGYGTLGINNQGGDTSFLFQYALQPTQGPFDQAASMKMAMEHQNPFVTGTVNGGDFYPADSYSLLSIEDPDILLWSLKPAEEGATQGLIARMWNQGDEDSLQIVSELPIISATNTSHVETDISTATVLNGKLDEYIGAQEIKTFRLFFGDTAITSNDLSLGTTTCQFKISPNPAHDQITVGCQSANDGEYLISIINNTGEVVRQEFLYNGSNPTEKLINISSLPSGIYYIFIRSDRNLETIKLIKQ